MEPSSGDPQFVYAPDRSCDVSQSRGCRVAGGYHDDVAGRHRRHVQHVGGLDRGIEQCLCTCKQRARHVPNQLSTCDAPLPDGNHHERLKADRHDHSGASDGLQLG